MLLNKQAVRQFALAYAKRSRTHKFTRVSEDFYQMVENKARNYIRDLINRHPGKGVTLKP